MRYGIIPFSPNGFLRYTKGANTLDLKAPTTISNSYTLTFPSALPGTTQAMTVDSSGNIGFSPLSGGGSVTSVGLDAPSIFTVTGSPITASGNLSFSLNNQASNTFFAAPAGSAGAPTFRGIVWTDISGLAGTSSTSFAIGNDPRFHNPNADTGTSQTSFQIDSENVGPRLKNTSGVLEIRNAGDTSFSDIRVGNLFVTGTQTIVNSETVTVDDNVIVLNNNVSSGTPTEDLGIEGKRGSQTSASLKWIESLGRWASGLVGAELPIARVFETTFTNASLTAGLLTVTHGLGRRIVKVQIANNNNQVIVHPDEITYISSSQLTIDFTSFGTLTGTWTVVAVG